MREVVNEQLKEIVDLYRDKGPVGIAQQYSSYFWSGVFFGIVSIGFIVVIIKAISE